MSDYDYQVEKKLRFVVQELEKLYELMERYSDPGVQELLEAHRKLFIGMNTAYLTYIKELKSASGFKMLELPRIENSSTKYGGNS